MAGTLWIMNCKNAIKWEHTILCNLSTKINIISVFYDDFYLTSRVQNALVREPTRLWYFLGGRMESPKHSWLNIKSHLKQIQITISQDHISVQKKNTCINGKKENRWQKVLDNIWERSLVHHTCIDTESIVWKLVITWRALLT